MKRAASSVGTTTAVVLLLFSIGLDAQTGNATAGTAVYGKRCRTCHGATGAGNPAMAKTLGVPIRALGSAEVQQKADEELRKNSVDGLGKMKPVTGLSATDAVNLVAYIRSLKKPT